MLAVATRLVIAALLLSPVNAEEPTVCPTNRWIKGTNGCYQLSPVRWRFHDATTFCKGQDAYVTSAKSQDENNFVANMIGENRHVWLNLQWNAGNWWWQDDTTIVRYNNWFQGNEPSSPQSRGCITISGENEMWFAFQCTAFYDTLCVKLTPETPTLTASPNDTTVKVNTSVTLTCFTTSTPMPGSSAHVIYTFYKDGNQMYRDNKQDLPLKNDAETNGTVFFTCTATIAGVTSQNSKGHKLVVVGAETKACRRDRSQGQGANKVLPLIIAVPSVLEVTAGTVLILWARMRYNGDKATTLTDEPSTMSTLPSSDTNKSDDDKVPESTAPAEPAAMDDVPLKEDARSVRSEKSTTKSMSGKSSVKTTKTGSVKTTKTGVSRDSSDYFFDFEDKDKQSKVKSDEAKKLEAIRMFTSKKMKK